MTEHEARRWFADERVGRLATVDDRGRPHLVPIVFACAEDRIVTAVDEKPKRTRQLKRLSNIRSNSLVSVLVDHYDEDWGKLWWARADGQARIVEQGPEFNVAVELLADKYEQYERAPPRGPVVLIDVTRWSSWRATGE